MSVLSADPGLLAQLKLRDPVAWRRVVDDEHGRIFRLAYRLVGPAEAEDVTQEVFRAAWKHIEKFRGDAKIGTWLYGIGLNKCRLSLRKRKRRTNMMQMFAEQQAASAAVQPDCDTLDERELVREAFDRLDKPLRLVLILLHYEGLTYQQIGEELGWRSKATVAKKVQQATQRLKELISQLRGGGC